MRERAQGRRAFAVVAMICAGLCAVIWAANLLELTLLRPSACSVDRMRFEAWLLLARAPGVVLPLPGLVAGTLAARPWSRAGGVALLANVFALALVVALVSAPKPAAWPYHLPCLRD